MNVTIQPCKAENLDRYGQIYARSFYRVMRICMATGHAAGIAAALMSENCVSSREIDVRRVQAAVGIRKTCAGDHL